jgi:hypothetical protein
MGSSPASRHPGIIHFQSDRSDYSPKTPMSTGVPLDSRKIAKALVDITKPGRGRNKRSSITREQ